MSEEYIKVAQGTNPRFVITARDLDGDIIDLRDYPGYGFTIFQNGGDKELVRFSKNVLADWQERTEIVDEEHGKFAITIPLKYTREGDIAKYRAEISIQTNAGSNVFLSKNPGGKAFIELVKSTTKNVTALA
jgi:hypothetical protein